MDVATYILHHTTAAIILAGILIAISGFILRKYKILSIVLIVIASLIIYVLLYKTSPLPQQPQTQEKSAIE
ncbi:MAG TPA: hypothetical protein PLO73_14340 [Spirochaetota bacterium]|nr:hypothetical protein [Spirochaetota bacterium]